MWCVYDNKGRFPLLFFAVFVVSLIFDWIMSSSKKRGKHCAVFGCNNSYYNDEGLFGGYHFFKFPTSPKRRNRWCNLIKRQHGRDGFTVTSSTVVCNEHFKQEEEGWQDCDRSRISLLKALHRRSSEAVLNAEN